MPNILCLATFLHLPEDVRDLFPSNRTFYACFRSINKDEWSWRALRFLSRKCPHFYINWNPPGRPVKDYLSVILTEKIQSEVSYLQTTF